MTLYVDKGFVGQLGRRLPLFKQKSEYLWNFRCPICGDSKKDKLKARGYIYRRQNSLYFTCHNCNQSLTLGNFIKAVDPVLYDEYLFAEMVDKRKEKPDLIVTLPKTNVAMEEKFAEVISLPTIASLAHDHIAKVFLLQRKIPTDRFDELYYAFDFAEFINELMPEHGKNFKPLEKRIIIPWLDENNKLLGIQGRAIDANKIRYISVKLKETNRKLFGLNRIDTSKIINVVEGPFDSMFINNCVASMDSSLYSVIPMIGPELQYRFIYDNEPHNKDVIRAMQKTIDMGQPIVIWPNNIDQKDINDMVLAGLNPEEIIKTRTYDGLHAQLELNEWKKI